MTDIAQNELAPANRKAVTDFSTPLVMIQATTLSLLLAAIHWVGAVLALSWTVAALIAEIRRARIRQAAQPAIMQQEAAE